MKTIAACVSVLAGLLGVGVLAAPAASATPGYGQDCILPSVSTCRLMPDAEGPHDVQRFCPGKGWVNVFTPCPSRLGPYS